MRNPDQAESRVCVFTREMAKSLRFSPYRLRDNAEKDGQSQIPHSTLSPYLYTDCRYPRWTFFPLLFIDPQYLPSTRPDPADMASYTDKYKQKRSLNALNLNAEQLGLEKDFFPRQIWEMYFEGKDPEGQFKNKTPWTSGFVLRYRTRRES
jgi:hypothetical protein